MKKLSTKILSIIMLLFITFSMFQNYVSATEINSASLINGGDCGYHLQFNDNGTWSYVLTHYVYYNYNGQQYPAYCLDVSLAGVDENLSYTVNINSVLNDVRIWRVIINGFPYKTASEMGVQNNYDAFVATKHAIYCILYNRDVRSYYRGGDYEGQLIVDEIERLVNEGRNGTRTPLSANVTINQVGGFTDEGNYYSQTFSVSSVVDMASYTITSTPNMPSGGYVADVNGNPKTSFTGGENFKVYIPKNQLVSDINTTITVQAKCETYPIFYGESPSSDWQPYAITFDPYGDVQGYATFNLKTNTAKLQINKVDSETNEGLQGVTFEVRKSSGELVGTYTTDSNGQITVSNLYQGEYVVKETQTQEQYIINTAETSAALEFGKTTQITVTNDHKKGNLKIVKVDQDDNRITLGGIEFDLIDSKGNVVKHLTTDVNGEISVENINTGTYTLRETKTKNEYALSADVGTTVTWNDTTNLQITNEKKKGQIRVIKVDQDNNEVRIPGVTFEIYDKYDGKFIEKLVTDSNGVAVSSRLPIGDYIIKETATLDNYVLDDTPQVVTLEENQIKDIQFENERIKGQIQITKLSNEDNPYSGLPKGSPLEGAVYNVLDDSGNIVDTVTTGADGTATTKMLYKGKYHIQEVAAPKYYLIDENTYDTEIKTNKQVAGVTVSDNSVDISVEVQKSGFVETQSNDTIYYNFKNITNSSNVSLDNFTWQDTFPTNALRIQKIYTGTWNQDLTYSIWYKTNMNDYILLKDNLSTNTNNEIDFTNVPLQNGEYITDYQFRFGTVNSGFHEVDSPVLYCKMLDGLGNGFVFTNNTKVSGNYLDKYVEANDKWTTTTYEKSIQLDTLPRTGF